MFRWKKIIIDKIMFIFVQYMKFYYLINTNFDFCVKLTKYKSQIH